MKLKLEMRTKTTVKTTVKRRLILRSAAGIAVAALLGAGIFFYGNFGNNAESLASNKTGNLKKDLRNTATPKGPTTIKATCTDQEVVLSWINNTETKNGSVTDGILILRKAGLVFEDQSLDILEKDSTANKTIFNGWDIVYNGTLVSTFTDITLPGVFTYLIYEKNNGIKYTDEKDAARVFVLNGTNLSETILSDTKLDGLYLPATCALTVGDKTFITISEKSEINIDGTFVLRGQMNNDAASWTFNENAEFIYDRSTYGRAEIPVAKWEEGSTCMIKNTNKIVPEGINQTFANFIWDCVNQKNDVLLPGEFTVNGNLEIKSTGAFEKALKFNGINTFNGDVIVSNTAVVEMKNKCSIVLSGNTLQKIQGLISFESVTFNNPEGFELEGMAMVNKTINLKDGKIIIPNSSTFKIADEVVVNRTNGSFEGSPSFLGTYSLNYYAANTTGEEIASSENALQNLTLDFTGNLKLSKTVHVNNELEFIKGKIVTGNYEVDLKNNSAKCIKGYSLSNYVVGNLRRSVNGKSSYDFPVGTEKNCELVSINLSKTEGFTNLLAHFNNAKPDVNLSAGELRLNGSPVGSVLDNGYWTLSPNSPMTEGTFNVTLNQKGQSNKATSERCYCIIKRDGNSSGWNFNGKHSMKTQDEKNGIVTASRFNMTSFGDLAIGYSPVSLLLYQSSFTASLINNKYADIVWRTSVENNYSSLIAERSSDSYNYEPIGELKENKEKGSTIEYSTRDVYPYPGISYYRVKQTDAAGEISYSNVSFINNETKMEASLNTK